jgi:hypothetical protein
VNPPNHRITRLRAIVAEQRADAGEFEDELPTQPGVIPAMRPRMSSVTDATEERAATFLERVLAAASSWHRVAALAFILGAALVGFYLWKTLP